MEADLKYKEFILSRDQFNISLACISRLKSCKEKWIPLALINAICKDKDRNLAEVNNRNIGDLMGCYPFSVFSEKAVNALGKYMLPYGELLPASYQDELYFVFHNLTLHENIIDEEKSHLDDECAGLNEYHFNISNVTAPIFSLPHEENIGLYVTEEFKQTVESHQLTGFSFCKIWSRTP